MPTIYAATSSNHKINLTISLNQKQARHIQKL